MKKTIIMAAVVALSSIALAQSAGTGASSSTTLHPAANKETNKPSELTVPSRDGVYSNPNRQRASDELNKKKIQSRSTNGVIDQGAPGGIGDTEGKGQSNPTHPQTE